MSPPATPYAGRWISLATRHGKERVIGRAVRCGLGARLQHLSALDTDALGSFCGSVARRGDALQACIAKAELALAEGSSPLAIASEGSFGPHPAVPLLAVGLELMVFRDRERDLTIHEQLLARRTNFSQRLLASPGAHDPIAGLEGWLQQVGFPSHGVLVRSAGQTESGAMVIKGLHDPQTLRDAIRRLAAACPGEAVQLETDMRAHCNPTRMASIRQLAFLLVRRIATPCPDCGSPGWGRIGSEAGLPCAWCGRPTALRRADLLGCVRCELRRELPRADGLQRADPEHCAHCNP